MASLNRYGHAYSSSTKARSMKVEICHLIAGPVFPCPNSGFFIYRDFPLVSKITEFLLEYPADLVSIQVVYFSLHLSV